MFIQGDVYIIDHRARKTVPFTEGLNGIREGRQ